MANAPILAELLPNGMQQFFDANGKPLAGGSVEFFIPGTTSHKSTWGDPAETILNPNPVVLDTGGRAIIYGSGQYRQVVKDVCGNLIWDQLTFGGLATGTTSVFASIAALRANLAAGLAAAWVQGYYGPGDKGGGGFDFVTTDTTSPDNGGTIIVDAVGQRWYRDFDINLGLSLKWFGARGDGATDDSLSMTKALAAAAGARLDVPAGTYIAEGISLPSSITLTGAGKHLSVFKRKTNSANHAFIAGTNATNVTLRDLGFDGNGANQTVGANTVAFTGSANLMIDSCWFANAKAAAGFGSAITINNGVGRNSLQPSTIQNCTVENNDATGISVTLEYYLLIQGNIVTNNGGNGIAVGNSVYPPVANSQDYVKILNNSCGSNQASGIAIQDYYTGGSPAVPFFGPFPADVYCLVEGNNCFNNAQYGIAYQGSGGAVVGNVCSGNGTLLLGGAGGGILFNCLYSTLSGNTLRANSMFGCDAGGSIFSAITGNVFIGNGVTQSNAELNLGASQGNTVTGNDFTLLNDGAMHIGMAFSGIDGASATISFPQRGLRGQISDNTFYMDSNVNSLGLWLAFGVQQVVVKNNTAWGASPNKGFVLECESLAQFGNVDQGQAAGGITPGVASAATTVIPDVGENFYVSGTTNITTLYTTSQNTWNGKVRDVAMTAVGSLYTPGAIPAVAFSGGGGSGAAGTIAICNDGTIIGVHFTNHGSGYTSAPTVTFPASQGGGTLATGSAFIGCANQDGRVISLFFTGALTVVDGNNLHLVSDFTTVAGKSTLVLRGAFGGLWYEVSRCTVA